MEFILINLGIVTKCSNAVFLSLLGWKQMESYGFFTMNRERLIERIYGRSSTSFFNVLL
jgi:hypothetical protein